MQSSVKNFVLVFIANIFLLTKFLNRSTEVIKYAVATNVKGEIIKLYQISKK